MVSWVRIREPELRIRIIEDKKKFQKMFYIFKILRFATFLKNIFFSKATQYVQVGSVRN